MGAGYWLNPKTHRSWVVDRHELWVLEADNAKAAGIASDVYNHLLTLDRSLGMDEIRLAGINVGLVRIRDHGNYISVQFAADQVRDVLRSIHDFLIQSDFGIESDLWIDNFTSKVSTRITIRDLGQRLDQGRTVMGEVAEPEKRPLTLDQFLKLSGLVETGGHAKFLIQNGEVRVNGQVETRRRRRLVVGDVVEFGGKQLKVKDSLFSW